MSASGAYIQQSDVEDIFGQDNAAKWSNLDNLTEAANENRIERAILWAEALVEDRFRNSDYVVPFVADGAAFPRVMTDWMARLAGIWLFRNRGQLDDEKEGRFDDMVDRVKEEIDRCLSNQQRLALVLNEADSPTAPTAVA